MSHRDFKAHRRLACTRQSGLYSYPCGSLSLRALWLNKCCYYYYYYYYYCYYCDYYYYCNYYYYYCNCY